MFTRLRTVGAHTQLRVQLGARLLHTRTMWLLPPSGRLSVAERVQRGARSLSVAYSGSTTPSAPNGARGWGA